MSDNSNRRVKCLTIGLAAALSIFASAAMAQDRALVAAARGALSQLQDHSFRNDREYCGFIARDDRGAYVVLPAYKGRAYSCLPLDRHSAGREIVASFHTHGSYAFEADSEVPSSDDVLGDVEMEIDGFVSTPGGRLWFVDGQRGEVRQICGLGCLPQDPAFKAGVAGPIAGRYSLDALIRRERE